MVSDANVPVEHKHSLMIPILDSERKEEYADYMQASLLSFVELLDPLPLSSQVLLRPDVAVTALSMLCIASPGIPRRIYHSASFERCMHRSPGYVSRQNREVQLDLIFPSTEKESITSCFYIVIV